VAVSGTSWVADFATPASAVATGEVFAATVRAIDGAGNVTELTPSVTVDLVAPTAPATIAVANPGNVVVPLVPYNVSGISEVGSSVIVTIGGSTISAVVAGDGSWNAGPFASPVLPATTTDNAFVTVTDAAGNVGVTTPYPFTILAPAAASEAPQEIPLSIESLVAASPFESASPESATASWSAAATTAALVPLEQPYS
jgi:hypothetical protein